MPNRLLQKIPPKKRALSALSLMLIALLFLLYLPANHFDEGDSICLSVVLFDMECYGCGMTRGIQHLIHLDFAEAWHYNKLAFVVFPLLLYLMGNYIYTQYRLKDHSD